MRRSVILLVLVACVLAQDYNAPAPPRVGCDHLTVLECTASRGHMQLNCTCKRPFSRLGAKVIGYVGFILVCLFWLA